MLVYAFYVGQIQRFFYASVIYFIVLFYLNLEPRMFISKLRQFLKIFAETNSVI